MNYYRRYIGDYMRATGDLSLSEHGVYTVLLDTQYATEKGFPVEIDRLMRLCRAITPEEQAAVRTIAERFFPVIDGERWNRRAREEIGIAQEVIGKQRAAGAEAAAKRWGNRQVEQGSTMGKPTKNDGSAIQPPSTIHQPPVTNLQSPATKEQQARASRLPQDWTPSDEQFEFCLHERPDLKASEVAARFRDYWVAIPGAKGRKLDWTATWRNWVRNEARGQSNGSRHESDREKSRRETIEGLTGQRTIDIPAN